MTVMVNSRATTFGPDLSDEAAGWFASVASPRELGRPVEDPVTDNPWWEELLQEVLDDQADFLADDYEPVAAGSIELYRKVMQGIDDTGFAHEVVAVFAMSDGGLRLQLRLGEWMHSLLLHSDLSQYYAVPTTGAARYFESDSPRDLVAAFGYALGHVA